MGDHTSGKIVSDNDPSVQRSYDTYTDNKSGDTNIVETNDARDKNPHTHEVVGTDHADVTDASGKKTDSEHVKKNSATYLDHTIQPDES